MKAEELFLSTEQCKHLQELGLDMSDAAFCWMIHPTNKKSFVTPTQTAYLFIGNQVPTYTLQEVLKKIPESTDDDIIGIISLSFKSNRIVYEDCYGTLIKDFYIFEHPLKAAYEMLCWVLEQGYYKPLQNVTT